MIDEKIIHEESKFIVKRTNNQAEYQAIIEALSKTKIFTNGAVEVFSDSELVINQINGDYQVKNAALSKLFKQVIGHKNSFQKIKFIHVPRDQHWISKVDKLCNSCLNEYARK